MAFKVYIVNVAAIGAVIKLKLSVSKPNNAPALRHLYDFGVKIAFGEKKTAFFY